MRLLKAIIKDFKKRVCNQKGQMDWGSIIGAIIGGGIGSFGGPGTMAIGAGIGGGIGGMFGGDDEMSQWDMWEREFEERKKPPEFYRAPEYPEAIGAREAWGGKLQEWGAMPGYGAIAPDWGDIWERAKKRVSQQYWGGPGGEPGLAAKVRAGAAARGVAESPALETGLTRMGYQEAGQLEDIATEQAIRRAEFGERGRGTWLENVRALAGMQVPGAWSKYGGMAVTQPTPTTPWGDIAGAAGEYFGTSERQKSQQDWIEKMMEMYGMGGGRPTAMPTTITGGGGEFGFGGGFGGAEQFMKFMR